MPDRELSKAEVHLALEQLADTKMFFAHQSVGDNLLNGVASIQNKIGTVRLRLVDLKKEPHAADDLPAVFAHARLGQNRDARGKTAAFVSVVEAGIGRTFDIVFHKYCFVDIDASTGVTAVFDNYRQSMEKLRLQFPALTRVHVTTPLVTVQSGPKALVKKWLGRAPDHYADNIARESFNDLMRREYRGREPVFDLAALEASRPGGSPQAVHFGEANVYSLLRANTNDGAHLNAGAQIRIASQLLVFLARAVKADRHHASSQSE